MDIEGYYRSLHSELDGLRDRVRHLIGDAHWPTDGGWKESVLRSVLRRSLGSGVELGHGFFVTADRLSPQIDILAWRSDAPVLFRDGSLVILPAHAVRAVIEVKSTLTTQTFREGVTHLISACDALPARNQVVVGLFAYETVFRSSRPILRYLRNHASHQNRLINLVCNGPNRFVRYWNTDPDHPKMAYEKWHSYDLPELAYGYFVSNVITHLTPSEFPTSGEPFYPRGGKEPFKDGDIYRSGAPGERWLKFGVDIDGDRARRTRARDRNKGDPKDMP